MNDSVIEMVADHPLAPVAASQPPQPLDLPLPPNAGPTLFPKVADYARQELRAPNGAFGGEEAGDVQDSLLNRPRPPRRAASRPAPHHGNATFPHCSPEAFLGVVGVLLLAVTNYLVMQPPAVQPPTTPSPPQKPLCQNAAYTIGQWRSVKLNSSDTVSLQASMGYHCAYYSPFHCLKAPAFPAFRLEHERTLQQAVDIARWRWEPSGCSLPRFDVMDFAEILANRSILITGDLTALQMYDSLRCQLAPLAHHIASGRALSATDPTTFSAAHWDENVTLYPLVLADTGGSVSFLPLSGREPPGALRRWRLEWFDFVVLGMSATTKLVTLEAAAQALIRTLRGCPFTGRLLVRTLHRSSSDCTDHSRPAASVAEAPPREWAEYDAKDAALLKTFRDEDFPVTVLYANMTNLRWDAYLRQGDCQHTCLPGPPDTWNRLLYLQLMLWQKQEDGEPTDFQPIDDPNWEPDMDVE
eukprot:GGOE01037026.1.p2 GENE.GGOE01037026.1~~GGOE01037026.1.p2  ORF type:complete len:470 (-),score=123.14 GGOE01037026.1:204-1613(-)